jgi:hypothetical protein
MTYGQLIGIAFVWYDRSYWCNGQAILVTQGYQPIKLSIPLLKRDGLPDYYHVTLKTSLRYV